MWALEHRSLLLDSVERDAENANLKNDIRRSPTQLMPNDDGIIL